MRETGELIFLGPRPSALTRWPSVPNLKKISYILCEVNSINLFIVAIDIIIIMLLLLLLLLLLLPEKDSMPHCLG